MSNQSETAEILQDAGKLRVAEGARLMAENQQTLNRTNEQDDRERERHQRVQEALAKRKLPDLPESEWQSLDDDMRINVDSPTTTTVNHNYPPKSETPGPVAAMKKTVGPIVKAAIAVALLGSGIGVGAAMPWVLGMLNPPAVETPADTIGQIVLE